MRRPLAAGPPAARCLRLTASTYSMSVLWYNTHDTQSAGARAASALVFVRFASFQRFSDLGCVSALPVCADPPSACCPSACCLLPAPHDWYL
jgi:hypothetical protein